MREWEHMEQERVLCRGMCIDEGLHACVDMVPVLMVYELMEGDCCNRVG